MTEEPSNPEMEVLRQEIERLREVIARDMERRKTELDGRINVVETKIDNLNQMVYGILIVIVVGVIVAAITYLAGLT